MLNLGTRVLSSRSLTAVKCFVIVLDLGIVAADEVKEPERLQSV